MDLPIAIHNIEVKLNSIRKHVQHAIDDNHDRGEETKVLERLSDRIDNGAGDLSCKEELKYLNSLRLTKRRVHSV